MGLADRPLASAVSISSVFVMNVLDPRRCCIKMYTQQELLCSACRQLASIGYLRYTLPAMHMVLEVLPNAGDLQGLWLEESVTYKFIHAACCLKRE